MTTPSSINGTDIGNETGGVTDSNDALYKGLSEQLAERTSTAQEFFDIKVIELSDNPNTPGTVWVLHRTSDDSSKQKKYPYNCRVASVTHYTTRQIWSNA